MRGLKHNLDYMRKAGPVWKEARMLDEHADALRTPRMPSKPRIISPVVQILIWVAIGLSVYPVLRWMAWVLS